MGGGAERPKRARTIGSASWAALAGVLALSGCGGDSPGQPPTTVPLGVTCGNGTLEAGETCDPAGSCPSACDDGVACTTDQLTGSAQTCNAACGHALINACVAGDGCCPAGCRADTDSDCSSQCGNGVLDEQELCDPPGTCPTQCDDGDACTTDQLTGSADNCSAACAHAPVTACSDGDGCCPSGCDGSRDGDCSGAGPAPATADAGSDPETPAPACQDGAIGKSPNTLSVDVNAAEHLIHREIFGVLLEILGRNVNGGIYVGKDSAIPNTNGIRNDIIEGFKEAGVGAIQWPGGCAANNYDWRANLRPANTMGTDLFMEFSQAVAAEPFLVGRPQPQYAQSNREWVEYVNNHPDHPEWQLKYFKVGNEVWGCGGNLGTNVDTYEGWYNTHYDALKTPVNGKELFLVGATGGIWTINPNGNNWLSTMLSPGHLADRVDGIEIHDYIYFPDDIPSVGFSESQYYDIVHRANQGQIAPRIRDIRTILDRHDPQGRIQIMEDEWGDWLIEFNRADTWFQQVTLMDAISAAEHLHVFMANADRMRMAGLAQSTNVIHALFLTNSSSGGSDLVKTPAFYVFKLLVPHHENGAMWAPHTLASEQISGNGKSFPVLSTGTSVNAAGEVHISLANVDLQHPRDITITLDSDASGYTVRDAQVITGEAKDSYNDFGKAERVHNEPLADTSYTICGRQLKVTLPSKSVVMLALTPH